MADPETPTPQGSNVVNLDAERERIRTEERATAQREERDRTETIGKLCADAGFPTLAASMGRRGISVDAVKVELDTAAGIKDAASAAKLDAAETDKLIAQIETGLTLRQACAKITTLQAAASGPEIFGRHTPNAGTEQQTPIDVDKIYAKRREQGAEAHAHRYGRYATAAK